MQMTLFLGGRSDFFRGRARLTSRVALFGAIGAARNLSVLYRSQSLIIVKRARSYLALVQFRVDYVFFARVATLLQLAHAR